MLSVVNLLLHVGIRLRPRDAKAENVEYRTANVHHRQPNTRISHGKSVESGHELESSVHEKLLNLIMFSSGRWCKGIALVVILRSRENAADVAY